MYSQYNEVGHVCSKTNRKGIRAADALIDENNVVWLFSVDAATVGLDPWRLIDSIDPHTDHRSGDVWLDNGMCVHVPDLRTCVVYVQQPAV